jgi:hypothetical protein
MTEFIARLHPKVRLDQRRPEVQDDAMTRDRVAVTRGNGMNEKSFPFPADPSYLPLAILINSLVNSGSIREKELVNHVKALLSMSLYTSQRFVFDLRCSCRRSS